MMLLQLQLSMMLQLRLSVLMKSQSLNIANSRQSSNTTAVAFRGHNSFIH